MPASGFSRSMKRRRLPSSPGSLSDQAAMISPTSSSPSPTTTKSMKGAMGSGLEKAHTPPISTTRVPGPAIGGPQREPRHPQHPDHVDVVALVGHREADQVEVGQRPVGLEREGRGPGAAVLVHVLGIREEDALADHVRERVEVAVDGLEAQVRHADRVGVRIDQRDGHAPAPVLADDALFRGDQLLSLLLEFPGHTEGKSITGNGAVDAGASGLTGRRGLKL